MGAAPGGAPVLRLCFQRCGPSMVCGHGREASLREGHSGARRAVSSGCDANHGHILVASSELREEVGAPDERCSDVISARVAANFKSGSSSYHDLPPKQPVALTASRQRLKIRDLTACSYIITLPPTIPAGLQGGNYPLTAKRLV